MRKIKLVFILASLTAIQFSLFSQNNTNSPYTRYGYGELADQAFAGQRAMGGIGIGLRNSQMINTLNPASYSNVDSMTFMVDFGLNAQMGWYNDNGKKASKLNGGLEYLALQFPLYRHLGVGIGFKPISYVGYQYGDAQSIGSNTVVNWLYNGSGGLSQVYTSLSYDIAHRLSVGANLGYVFGNIIHDRTVRSSESTSYAENLVDTLSSRAFSIDMGLQYVQPLSKDKRLVFGATFSPKLKMKAGAIKSLTIYDPSSGQISYYSTNKNNDYSFSMPQSYGFGVTYNQLKKMTLGADFQYQKWSEAEYYSVVDTFKNRTKVKLGGEYIIDSRSRNLFKRISYRAGLNYADSYFSVQGAEYKEYGASVGFGVPMLDNRSFLNFTFEYKALRPTVPTLIDEQYFKFTFSYTFNELWFFKKKVQ